MEDKRLDELQKALMKVYINESDSRVYAGLLIEFGCDHVTQLGELEESDLTKLNITKPMHVRAILRLGAAMHESTPEQRKVHFDTPMPAPTPATTGPKSNALFISHSKNETGETASTLYDHVCLAYPDRQIFLDVQKAFSLSRLSQIASDSEVIMVLASSDYWTRPWCVTEIVKAKKGGSKIFVVNIWRNSGFDYDTYRKKLNSDGTKFINELLDSGSWEILAENDITVEDVKDALKWFLDFKGPQYHQMMAGTMKANQISTIIDCLKEILPPTKAPLHRRASMLTTSKKPLGTKWRFCIKGDDMMIRRRRLEVKLWEQSNGWFRLTLNDDGNPVTKRSAEEGGIKIVPFNMDPIEVSDYVAMIPEGGIWGQWTFETREDSTDIIVRNRIDGRTLKLKDDSLLWEKAESARTPSVSRRPDGGGSSTKWRFRIDGDDLFMARRRLEVRVWGKSTGWFDLSLNDKEPVTKWSGDSAKISIASGNLDPIEKTGYTDSIPKESFGVWEFESTDEHDIVVRHKTDKRILRLRDAEFRFSTSGGSDTGDEGIASDSDKDVQAQLKQLAKALSQLTTKEGGASESETSGETKWRFRRTEEFVFMRRRRLEIQLPISSNGWFYLKKNDEDKEIKWSSDQGGISIAPGNLEPVAEPGFTESIPGPLVGNWTFSKVSGSTDVLVKHSDGRKLILKAKAFEFTAES